MNLEVFLNRTKQLNAQELSNNNVKPPIPAIGENKFVDAIYELLLVNEPLEREEIRKLTDFPPRDVDHALDILCAEYAIGENGDGQYVTL